METVDKVIEGDFVKVIISSDGIGWYTLHEQKKLLFSPEIITILEKYKKVNLKKPYYFSDKQHKKVEAIERSKLRNIQKIIDKLGYLDNKNINLKNNLEIRVIGVGKKFRIRFENWQGYASKGFESIEIYNSTDSNNWLIA